MKFRSDQEWTMFEVFVAAIIIIFMALFILFSLPMMQSESQANQETETSYE